MCKRPPSKKWRRFGNIWPSHAERFVCCVFAIRYIIYSTVGRSIASISDLGGIFTSAVRALANMVPRSYISAMDLPTVLYIIHISPPLIFSLPRLHYMCVFSNSLCKHIDYRAH